MSVSSAPPPPSNPPSSDEDDQVDAALSAPTRTRWTQSQSLTFYNTVFTVLTGSHAASVTYTDLSTQLKEVMAEEHSIVLDGTRIKARLKSASNYAGKHAEQQETLAPLRRKWERERQEFHDAQTERRQARAERAGRLRRSRQLVEDSDEEFDEAEPILQCTPVQRAMLKACQAYEEVKERFEEERKEQKAAETAAQRETKNATLREARRVQLLSTGFGAPEAEDDSTDSSSSTPKRKFNAAAVTSVYTEYLARQAKKQDEMAQTLRDDIKAQAAKTEEYREKKLRLAQEMNEKILALLGQVRDKENFNPNLPH